MATKNEWLEYLKAVQQYEKDLKKWVKKLPNEGEVSTESEGPGSNPPPPPPPPPGNP